VALAVVTIGGFIVLKEKLAPAAIHRIDLDADPAAPPTNPKLGAIVGRLQGNYLYVIELRDGVGTLLAGVGADDGGIAERMADRSGLAIRVRRVMMPEESRNHLAFGYALRGDGDADGTSRAWVQSSATTTSCAAGMCRAQDSKEPAS
jgi:hypothetical protein